MFAMTGVTVLGTGAKYLAVLEAKAVVPIKTHSLASLRLILSTGSPLTEQAYAYVYRCVFFTIYHHYIIFHSIIFRDIFQVLISLYFIALYFEICFKF